MFLMGEVDEVGGCLDVCDISKGGRATEFGQTEIDDRVASVHLTLMPLDNMSPVGGGVLHSNHCAVSSRRLDPLQEVVCLGKWYQYLSDSIVGWRSFCYGESTASRGGAAVHGKEDRPAKGQKIVRTNFVPLVRKEWSELSGKSHDYVLVAQRVGTTLFKLGTLALVEGSAMTALADWRVASTDTLDGDAIRTRMSSAVLENNEE